MKKAFALMLCVMMVAALFVGCDAGNATTGDSLKTGMAIISSTAKSKDAEEEDGAGQVDSVVVAVTVDKDNKIVNCFIDTAQTVISFSADGTITADANAEIKTKQEKKEEYGMKRISGIGKEWYEQANALAKYVEGKTVNQVKGIKVDESGYPSEADLTSSVTMNIAGYISAIEKAVENATDLGAKKGDKLGVGVVTDLGRTADATDEDEGLAQAYSHYAAVTVNSDGKITSCIIDASQTGVYFDASGKITSDKNDTHKTKQELGDAYGMKGNSGIGKEWNEQANAFGKYVVGKTASEVSGIAVDENAKPTSSDLTTSVTVSIDGMIAAVEKAVANAK
ncbi:MAG: hypothetical protein ACOX1Q_08025 [Eubacteriales bacterium]